MFFVKPLNSDMRLVPEEDLLYEYDTETDSVVLLRGYLYKAVYNDQNSVREEFIDLRPMGGGSHDFIPY